MTLAAAVARADVRERFWASVRKGTTCWEWTGARFKGGYGQFHPSRGITPKRAHRIAWLMLRGRIPAGLCVLHRCDNPPCVNPSHLEIGSVAKNNQDRALRGRSAAGDRHPNRINPAPFQGANNGRAKLTEDAVAEIRRVYRRGGAPDLARQYGVACSTVWRVVSGRGWSV